MLFLVTQNAGASFDSIATLAQYGVLGLVVIAIVFRKLVPGWVLDDKQADNERLRAELAALRAKMEDQVIPTLVRTTDILGRTAERGLGIDKRD